MFQTIWYWRKPRPKKKRQKRYRERNLRIVSTSLYLLKKNHNKKSLEGRFQAKIQNAVSGPESIVTTEHGKLIHRKHVSGPFVFQNEKKKERAPQIGDTEK